MSTNVDSGDEQVDAVASQATDVSQGSSDKPSQTIDYPKLAKELFSQEDTKEFLRRAAQGNKDKSVVELKGEVSNLTRAFELYEQGKNPQEAQETMDFEDNVAWLREQRASSQQAVSETADGSANLDVGTQLKQAGIDPTSDYGKSVAEGLSNKLFDNPTQFSNALIQEQSRLAQQPTPSAASAAAKGGSSVPATDATEQYKTDMIAARGRPGEIKAIKAQAIKDGVDVNNIGFRL